MKRDKRRKIEEKARKRRKKRAWGADIDLTRYLERPVRIELINNNPLDMLIHHYTN